MKNKKPSPSLADVAKAAGISRPAASYAMANRPGVSKATRERVLRLAKKMGFIPDARMGNWMARVRESKTRVFLPIAWLNTDPERDAWQKYKFMAPYLKGARERCEQLGYRLDEIWTHQPGMSMKRISQMLYQRGVEGVIITPPTLHIRLDSRHIACVALEGRLMAPRFNRVMSDLQFNLLLAVKRLRRYGYRRIGLCFTKHMTNDMHQAVMRYVCSLAPAADRVPSLLHPFDPSSEEKVMRQRRVTAWVKRYHPEVIVCYDNRMVEWVKQAGYRVPQEIGVIHLAIDDDVLDWAGIYSNREIVGRTAAEQVISLIQNRQFGVPDFAFQILIRGTWRTGRSLINRH